MTDAYDIPTMAERADLEVLRTEARAAGLRWNGRSWLQPDPRDDGLSYTVAQRSWDEWAVYTDHRTTLRVAREAEALRVALDFRDHVVLA